MVGSTHSSRPTRCRLRHWPYLLAVLVVLYPLSAISADKVDVQARIKKAKALRQEAKKLLSAGKLDQAEAKLKLAVKTFPAYPVVYNELGVINFRRKDYPNAVRYFRLSIKYKKKNPSALRNLGEAYRRLKDYNNSMLAFKLYTRYKPGDPDGWWGLARAAELAGQNGIALNAYKQYIKFEKRPDQKKYVERARKRVSALAGKVKKPVVVKKSQPKPKVKPKVQPRTKPKTARVVAKEIPLPVGVLPPDQVRLLAPADKLFAQRKYIQARDTYLKVLNHYPKNVNAMYRVGVSQAVLRRYNDAIKTWYRVLELRPGDRVTLRAITRTRIRLAWLRSKRTSKRFSRARYQSALVAIRKDSNDSSPALAQLRIENLMRVSSKNARLFWLRGEMKLQLGDFSAAIKDFHLARALRPLWEFPSYALAELFLRAGDRSTALKLLRQYAPSAGLRGLIVKRHKAFERELRLKTTPGH